ncbi:COG4223 family protein [Parvibaculum sp.]|uniref:COG4223 family protein n=1 Tax=Parvibaculum sp. TaxID=2024848 RepID=UPI003919B1A7
MSDSENRNGNSPEEGEAEYLKPEPGARDSRPQSNRKEAPVLDGVAEEVADEDKSASGQKPDEAKPANRTMRGNSNLLVAGGAGIGGAAAMLIGMFALGVLPAAEQDDSQIAALSERVAEIETSGAAAARSASEQADQLSQRLGSLEGQLAALAEAPDSAAATSERIDNVGGEVSDLKSVLGDTRENVASLQQALSALEGRLPPEGLGARVEGVDALVKALDIRLAALLPEVEKMEARVAALEEKEEDPDAAARAALGLALANLARAAESAGSFETELLVMRQFLPDQPELAGLTEAARDGVPTRAALEARFPSLAQSIFDAERRADEDGLWARFVANAKSLVTIRRTGEISGDTTEAVVARMEERLKVHDLGGAVAQAETLAGPAAEAAAPWLADAKARLETDRLVRELSARLAGELAAARG